MSTFPGEDPTAEALATRLGHAPADALNYEGARVTTIYKAMLSERGDYGSRYDQGLLTGWHGETRRRMFGQDTLGQLREVLRFERQLIDLASGAYGERQTLRQQACAQAEAERLRQALPQLLLTRLRAAGKPVALDDDGRITAPAGTVMDPTELADVREHRAALVELLRLEAESTRPVVIA